ncbi:hypothetical protein [Isorropodon fossajaponicum symbiont]|uniref:RraA family protein n=1 Tax=Isorropodon fossajaponicum symbiont TaxID=883811 RepID=UPI00247A6455|nr:hypothetical protein [Isorropodon fossajaponicum symbiont]
MMQLATADISDKLHSEMQYVEPIYNTYDALTSFSGQVETVKCFEDNSLVREILGTSGENKVLVVDAGGSKHCAMLDDQLATKTINNHWEGVVIYGLIRD